MSLHGVERTPKMYDTALSRKGSVKGFNLQLFLLKEGEKLPFEKNFFDVVYIESILGILSTEEIKKVLIQVQYVLKPGGRIGINETLWLEWVLKEERERINGSCMKAWGIPQANVMLISFIRTIGKRYSKRLVLSLIIGQSTMQKIA